ncbi:hypothetical protein CPB83DRAFT_855296 [Crepidotus variabilis]|uniref:F-box domain-containing protein n=1 Tax=Crepidotus variabilis TaxID=179855 RepID=A0A9P6EFB6_9AGAR|nr:hypothetical protein CPB83DRAFT_855296 [Crepidotus variabilis]
MTNSRSQTEPCPHCHISGPGSSIISDEVLAQCLRRRKDVCVACQKLADVERKIEETRRTLDILLKEKQALVSTLNDHHDLLSRQLPVEIASQIFLQSLLHQPEDLMRNRYYMEEPFIKSVFLPGQVSKHWRNIAEGTPKMWSVISVTINRNNCFDTVAFTREWLELSGDFLLYIQLRIVWPTTTVDKVFSSLSEKILALLIQHARRWKVIDFDVPNDFLPWISNTLLNHHLDRLEHVKLDETSARSPHLLANGVLGLQASPHRLTLGDLGVQLRQIAINMEHLTHFTSNSAIEMDECIKLFQVASRLSHCNLWRGVEGHISSDILVNCPSLHTLNFVECSSNWWKYFIFPSLETLSVYDLSDVSWMRLYDFLQRTGCKVKKLHVTHNNDGSMPDMLDILKLTPDLQQLKLLGGVLQEPFFSLMDAAASSTTSFLKNLTSLILILDDENFDWTWLLVFLTTVMTRPEKSLRYFKFVYPSGLSLEVRFEGGTLHNRRTFKLLLCVLEDVELELVDGTNTDLVKLLRHCHNI